MKNWKTTLAGFAAGFLTLFGPQLGAALSGGPHVPLTGANIGIAAALVALGILSKDASNTVVPDHTHDSTGNIIEQGK